MGEIEEEDAAAAPANANESTPLLSESNPPQRVRSVRTKVPEVEVWLYNQGKGPVDVFKSGLGGWDQDQLEVGEILDKYGFKSVYAFTPGSGRGAPIRFNPRNGRSLLSYRDGSVVYIDGQPKKKELLARGLMISPFVDNVVPALKLTLLAALVAGGRDDSLIKPITRILMGIAFVTVLIIVAVRETPDWARKLNFSGGRIPPWVLACAVILFTRLRKRTRNFLEKRNP